MKTPYAIGLLVVSVLVTVAIEESRIAAIKSAQEPVAAVVGKSSTRVIASSETTAPDAPPAITKRPRPAAPEPSPSPDPEPDDESFAKTARKMWDNPAGKSMMTQGAKIAVAMMYEDFIEDLDLSKEENDYFKKLLGKEITDQQGIGMKLMSASAEERKELTKEMTQRSEETQEEIKKFLNNEEDYEKFTSYKERLPERQQLDGIRATMTEKGVPLSEETESQLVDAMYRARTESKAPDLQGPEALGLLAEGKLVDSFEQNWESQQEALRAETADLLDETQQAAFQEFQEQMKDMQLMGLKMAEKMMSKEKDDSTE